MLRLGEKLGVGSVFSFVGPLTGTELVSEYQAAGSLVSLIGTTTPTVGQDLLLDGFVVVVVGGLSSIPGALLAAFLIGLVQSVSGFYLDDAWAKIITYALLYLTLVLRPQGFFGQEIEA